MGRLNKKQKKILALIDNTENDSMNGITLQNRLKDSPDNILPDIKLLEQDKLVWNQYQLGGTFPSKLTITPLGKARLKVGFGTRILDSVYEHPLTFILIILTIVGLLVTIYFASVNINSENQNKKENELQQNMPPTVSLTQKLMNESDGELKIVPTIYFKKNSDKLFTITSYEPNLMLNGIMIGDIGGGYSKKFEIEQIPEGTEIFPSIYATAINYYDFFNNRNVLTVEYVIEIKDMDNQITYRGNVTTEVNSSSTFQNGPLIFNWYKVSNT